MPHSQIEELRKLPVSEKLQIVEELWDDIGSSDVAASIPEWVKSDARRRSEELENHPDSALSRADVWRAVEANNG